MIHGQGEIQARIKQIPLKMGAHLQRGSEIKGQNLKGEQIK